MTNLKLSKWVKRSALAAIACAAFTMVSAEQAQAQYYGGRGGGFSLTIGNGGFGNFGGLNYGGFNRGFGGINYGGFNRGYGGFNSFNSGYRYSPQRSYYRGGGYGGGYGGGRSYYRRY